MGGTVAATARSSIVADVGDTGDGEEGGRAALLPNTAAG